MQKRKRWVQRGADSVPFDLSQAGRSAVPVFAMSALLFFVFIMHMILQNRAESASAVNAQVRNVLILKYGRGQNTGLD